MYAAKPDLFEGLSRGRLRPERCRKFASPFIDCQRVIRVQHIRVQRRVEKTVNQRPDPAEQRRYSERTRRIPHAHRRQFGIEHLTGPVELHKEFWPVLFDAIWNAVSTVSSLKFFVGNPQIAIIPARRGRCNAPRGIISPAFVDIYRALSFGPAKIVHFVRTSPRFNGRLIAFPAAVMPRRRKASLELPLDPYESAKVAGLRYVNGEGPGIRRQRDSENFTYLGTDGKPVSDEATLERIRSLVIPPAWEDVWICPLANGHLQAVGRDARGRKQYRYHPLYRAVRDATKFTRMTAFSQVLPAIRKQVEHDLRLPGLPRNKVLATVVRLLERTCIRVGNEEYARENGSFGLTTLRNNHVNIEGRTLQFHFKGKSGVVHDIELTDRRLAKIVRECQCIPGHELFTYVDDDGTVCPVHSEHVNAYLREITGEDFTAKDFRTWNGTAQAALELEALGPCDGPTQTKKNIVAAVKSVAERLGNRPATCRKYYVHPAVLDAYTEGTLLTALQLEPNDSWRREEVAIMKLVAGYRADVFHKAA